MPHLQFPSSLFVLVLSLLLSGMGLPLRGATQMGAGYRFRHLTTSDGLADNTVWQMVQDADGFMWLGTLDGLYRYDGYELRQVCRRFGQSGGRGASVDAIAADGRRARVWAGTDSGLFYWDTRRGRLVRFVWPADYAACQSASVSTLCVDGRGVLWIGVSGVGVFRYDADRCRIRRFMPRKDLPLSDIRSIQSEPDGTIRFLTTGSGVVDYQPSAHRLRQWLKRLLHINALAADGRGNRWIGTDDGFYVQKAGTRALQKVELRRTPGASRLAVNALLRYRPDTLALATSDGLFFYDIRRDCAEQLRARKDDVRALNSDYLNGLCLDAEGTLWVATYFGGVNILTPGNRNFSAFDGLSQRISGHVVSAFAQDAQQRVWIGTEDGGLSCWHPTTGRVDTYNPKLGRVSVPSFHNIHALMVDDGRLYVGLSTGGADVLDLNSGAVRHLTKSSAGLSANTVYSFAADGRGCVYVGTTAGLDAYNPVTGRVAPVKGLPKQRVNGIVADGRGQLWACGEKMGLWRRDHSGRWSDFVATHRLLRTRKIFTLAAAGEHLYIGTQDEGVFCYDLHTGRLQKLSLPHVADQIVYRIVPSGDRLWISVGKGLLSYHLPTGTSRFYSALYDLSAEQMNLNAGIRLRDGTLLFGHLDGLVGFRPDELWVNRLAPRVAITPLFAAQSEEGTAGVRVSQSAGALGFRLTPLSYIAPQANRLRYRLAPRDTGWTEMPVGRRDVEFPNLAPGHYELQVEAANADGVWSRRPARLAIEVPAPWWRSWPMLLAYVVLAGAVVAGWRRYRRKAAGRVRTGGAVTPLAGVDRPAGPTESPQPPPVEAAALRDADTAFLHRVDALVRQHLSDTQLSVGTMTKALGMGRTAFSEKMKATAGMTFSDYVRTQRLARAAERFRAGEDSVSQVAYGVGFSSPAYFCRCFKQQYHVSPSEYIKQVQAGAG